MRIIELLEGKKFNDLDFIKKDEVGESIDYDLCEDLVFFMHNDDDVYRRHVYPSINTCIKKSKSNQKFSPSVFTNAVRESYKSYIKQFPIRHLPAELDDEELTEVCKKMHEDFCKANDDGKYKD
jgi:hypothetical protein